ncbi:MAG TPA: hypothetical protein VFX16_01150 [Pseudonocardiaceae bacterium]|nr:hypothetical protein [Pseudonocardiaceae bacterium]
MYGITWAVWTLLLFVGAVAAMSSDSAGTGLLLLALGCVTAVYDWRIWTWQAKHLWFVVIF